MLTLKLKARQSYPNEPFVYKLNWYLLRSHSQGIDRSDPAAQYGLDIGTPYGPAHRA